MAPIFPTHFYRLASTWKDFSRVQNPLTCRHDFHIFTPSNSATRYCAQLPPTPHSATPLSESSPDDNGGRQCERGDHKAEIKPSPVCLWRLGKHKKMDHDPQTHREPQSKSN